MSAHTCLHAVAPPSGRTRAPTKEVGEMLQSLLLTCCLVLLLSEAKFCVATVSSAEVDNRWIPFDTLMSVGRAHSAVVFMNASFFIIGGCMDTACRQQVNMVDRIDPLRQLLTEHFELPITLNTWRPRTRHQKVAVPLKLAGPTAAVRVDDTSGREEPALYVVGACSYYHPDWQRTLSPTLLLQQQYNVIWQLSSDLKRVNEHFSIYPVLGDGEMEEDASVAVLRANATCTTYGGLILIIGGVNILTGEVLDTVDVYDTRKRHYVFNTTQLQVAVRNPLVAADSELIYVAGGEAQGVACKTDPADMLGSNASETNKRHISPGRRVASINPWCPSSSVQMIFMMPRMVTGPIREGPVASILSFRVSSLPANPELSLNSSSDGGISSLGSKHLFAFNGRLCLVLNSTFVNCLNMEKILDHDMHRTAEVCWTPLFQKILAPPVVSSTPFVFTLPVGILGAMLVLFEIGGFNADGMTSARVFFRTTNEYVTSVPNLDPVALTGKPLSLILSPPKDGYVRLSSDPICTENAAGTTDVQVFKRKDEPTAAVLIPRSEDKHVYVCFANAPVELPCVSSPCNGSTRTAFLFFPITNVPFRIQNRLDPSHSITDRGHSMVWVSVIVGAFAGVAIATVLAVMFVRLWGSPGAGSDLSMALLFDNEECEYDYANARMDEEYADDCDDCDEGRKDGKDEAWENARQWQQQQVRRRRRSSSSSRGWRRKSRSTLSIKEAGSMEWRPDVCTKSIGVMLPLASMWLNSKSDRDCLVKNTTHTSRYEVLRRIGEGAFSSVYLVQRKHDKQRFALKYLICADNKERLDAIRECETINSVQGHPNIIRLVEMFMNYEFDGGQQMSLPPPPQEAVAPALSFSSPQWTAIGVKRSDKIPCVGISCGVSNTQAVVLRAKPQEVDVGKSPPSWNAASVKSPRELSERCNLVAHSHIGGQSTLSGVDAQSAAFEAKTIRPPQAMQWAAGHTVDDATAKRQAISSENPLPPALSASASTPTAAAAPLPLVARGGKSSSLQDLSTSTLEQFGLQGPDPGTCAAPKQAAPLQKRESVHYCNFVQPSQAALLPPLPERQMMAYAPRNAFHYNDFDVTSAATGGAPLVPVLPPKDIAAPFNASKTFAPLRHVQTPVSNMQYTNFAAAADLGASNTGSTIMGPRAKPKTVADAIRATRVLKRSDGKTDFTMQFADPTATKAEAVNTWLQKEQQQQQHEKKGQDEEIKPVSRGPVTVVSPTAPPRKSLAGAGDTTKLAALGTSDTGPVHTRYLCLVMEYHPAGDLCGYVLRHSAKHNEELRRKLEEERKMCEGNIRYMEDDASMWVRLTSSDDITPSVFHPGKSSISLSHEARCQSSLDRPIFGSGDATVGSRTCSIIGADKNICREIETEFAMRANALTELQLLSIAYQLASVLHHLHSQRPPIVHRDLKPENILIRGVPPQLHGNDDDDGSTGSGSGVPSPRQHHHHHHFSSHNSSSVKIASDVIPIVVTDFGLAFLQEGRRRTGRGGGTRPYIAPESWAGQTTTASDIWSLGCVLYALATARLTVQTVRIMYEEAKRDGFAAMVLNDILAEKYSLAFASFVVSLLVVDFRKRPTAEMAMQCFTVDSCDDVVRFDPDCPFFSNVLDL